MITDSSEFQKDKHKTRMGSLTNMNMCFWLVSMSRRMPRKSLGSHNTRGFRHWRWQSSVMKCRLSCTLVRSDPEPLWLKLLIEICSFKVPSHHWYRKRFWGSHREVRQESTYPCAWRSKYIMHIAMVEHTKVLALFCQFYFEFVPWALKHCRGQSHTYECDKRCLW